MKAFSGGKNFMMPNCNIIKKLGDSAAIYLGLIVGQLDYYEDEMSSEMVEGWFEVSRQNVFDRIGHSLWKQEQARKMLVDQGVIQHKKIDRNDYFRVNMKAIQKIIKDGKKASRVSVYAAHKGNCKPGRKWSKIRHKVENNSPHGRLEKIQPKVGENPTEELKKIQQKVEVASIRESDNNKSEQNVIPNNGPGIHGYKNTMSLT